MKAAVEHTFTGLTTPLSSYDSAKTNLGTLMCQKTGGLATDKWAGPLPVSVVRPMEQSTAITGGYPHVIPFSSDVHWVFLSDNSSAAATRRITFYEYQISTGTWTWKGFITMNFVTNTGSKTVRGFRALRTLHTTGTVAASGTAVTGSGTQFVSERLAAGARIGFGSTDPTQITTWYEVASIASDTSITLSSTAGTVASGTPYVIEELRFAVAMTNATTTNGGLFLVKGMNANAFQTSGLNVNEAATADNIRGIYWLADASTVTNIVAGGLGLDSTSDFTQQYCYIINGTTTAQIFKYDLRSSLTSLTAGKSTSAFVFATGVSPTVTGTISQVNNGRIITASHGPGSGVKSFYFATTTRIYRVIESAITNGATNFLADVMSEIPPGGAGTMQVYSTMSSVDYSDALDRFVIMPAAGTLATRAYLTRYSTSDPMDIAFLIDANKFHGTTADTDSPVYPSISDVTLSMWSEGGIFYISRLGTTAITNQVYALPCGADWNFASSTNQRLITPAMATAGATKLYRAYVNSGQYLGDATLGESTEAFRLYVRTSGITDNSGAWTLLDDTHDLSGISAGTHVQFMFEFKTMGTNSIPARIYSVSAIYEDATTDSHYTPSVIKSSAANRQFAWRQAAAWGSNIPNLRVRIYNATTGSLVLDDTVSSSTGGAWTYSTDGTTFNAWSASADAVGNYIRYTATSLPAGIPVKAILTQ